MPFKTTTPLFLVLILAFGLRLNGAYTISPVAGIGNGDGGPATASLLASPQGLTFDGAGNLYIADATADRVRKVGPDGTISTFAGTGIAGFAGDQGPAMSARLNNPSAVAADKSGNVYIADTSNNRIRKVTPAGNIRTVAGPGVSGVIGDGGPATSGRVNTPYGVAVDSAGNIFISEIGNARVRIVVNGIIQTIVGDNSSGISGDGGPAHAAELNGPTALAVDTRGNLIHRRSRQQSHPQSDSCQDD